MYTALPRTALRLALLAIWGLACVGVLVLTLVGYEPGPRADAGVFFIWAMLALTFPAGLVPVAVFAAIIALSQDAQWGSPERIPSWIGFTLLWLGLVLAGYLQWFKALPLLLRRVTSARRPI